MNATHFDPGQLRHALVLEENLETTDAAGGSLENWQPVQALWGALKPISVEQERQADADETRATYQIFVRFADVIEPAMRFRDGDRAFLILSVQDPDETRRYLECETLLGPT